jgi:hypothetical protein
VRCRLLDARFAQAFDGELLERSEEVLESTRNASARPTD